MSKRRFRNWLVRKVVVSMLKDLLQFKWLTGNRTKVAAVVIAVLTLALNLDWLTQETYNTIVGVLTAAGLVTAAAHKPS